MTVYEVQIVTAHAVILIRKREMSSDFRNEHLVVIFAFCQNTKHVLIFRNKSRVNNWDVKFSFIFQKKHCVN